MGRVSQQTHIPLADINNHHLKPVLLPHGFRVLGGPSQQLAVKKGGDKFKRHNPHTLIGNHPAGKNRIETA